MNIIQKLIAFFTGTPRTPEDIIADMNKGAVELRERAAFEKEQIATNVAEVERVRKEVEAKEKELGEKNAVHAESIERSERVAQRFDDLTA
ncbi:hypothetical protein VPHF86_0265 [Vibrio phage F86]